jgi:hypothetical protein
MYNVMLTCVNVTTLAVESNKYFCVCVCVRASVRARARVKTCFRLRASVCLFGRDEWVWVHERGKCALARVGFLIN